MAACVNASYVADGDESFRTAEDIARDYANFTACVPERDVWIAEAGGEIAGYVRGWAFSQADGLHLYPQFGVVAPQWRRRGVGTALLAWVEARQREMASGFAEARGHAYQAMVNEGEAARAALLQKAGYRPERYFFSMVRPTLDGIADFALPEGLELRPVQPDHYRPIWDAYLRAFETHWGYSAPDEADYQAWFKSKVFQPRLWQVAWDTRTGEVAGQVRGFIDETYNATTGRKRGWTEFISVGVPWRRRGLARALISHSLRAQKAAGMLESALGVDGENFDGATRVYADCGFLVSRRNCLYRKSFLLARQR